MSEDFDYEREREALSLRADNWLREQGWRHTSNTPGCYWLWTRPVPPHAATEAVPAGTLILCDQKLALLMQGRIDAMDPAHLDGDDEDGDDA